MEQIIFDAYALVTYFNRDDGHQLIHDLILRTLRGDCETFISGVSLGELYTLFYRHNPGKADKVLRFIRRAGIMVEPVTRGHVQQAGYFMAVYRLTYGAAYSAALAYRHGALLVTGDEQYKPLDGTIDIQWL